MRDPYPELRAMREQAAAIPVENGGFRMWVVTRYEDVRRILTDPSLQRDLVKNRKRIVGQNLVRPEAKPKLPRELRRSMLDRDGADHRRLRGLVAGFFSPVRLAALRERIGTLADELLDALPAGEPVDLIDRFARPLPGAILSAILGVPAEYQEEFPKWETAILTADSKAEVEAAGRSLHAFGEDIIARKRAEPTDDLFSTLVRAEQEGVLAHDELTSMISLLVIAGLEPATAIGSAVLTLLRFPDQQAALLAQPELLPDCVEEVLRFETPFRMLTPRYLDHPLALDGVHIPAGELLLLSTGAANRDPDRFPDPDRFDITRRPKGHLGFSHGNHRCQGAELGRLVTTIGLDRLFRRYPDIRLAIEPEQARWRPGMFMRRLDALPVVR